MAKTEKQNRAWLQIKLTNFIYKIKNPNSYGSLKKQETLVKELRWIVDEFEKEILNKPDGQRCRTFGCVVCEKCHRSFYGDESFNNHKCK